MPNRTAGVFLDNSTYVYDDTASILNNTVDGTIGQTPPPDLTSV